jgi:nucleoid-associated protein YgaU
VTREHKLALLVGFSLVLIVGVLISDHFSPARNQEVSAGSMSAGTPVKFGGSAAGLQVAAEPRFDAQLPSTLISEPLMPQRLPEQIGSRAEESLAASGSGAGTQPFEMTMSGGRSGGTASAVPEPLRNDFEYTSGQFGERLARGGDGAPLAIPGPDSALKRSTTTTTPAPAPAPPPGKQFSTGTVVRHTVREGESIFRIAATHYGDGALWPRLREFNRGKIGSEGEIRDGVVLELPPKDVLLGTAVMPPPGVVPQRAQPTAAPAAPAKTDPPQKRGDDGGTHRIYVVKKGDELGTVARETLGSSRRWPEIAALNRDVLPDPDRLQAGMKLRIPAR